MYQLLTNQNLNFDSRMIADTGLLLLAQPTVAATNTTGRRSELDALAHLGAQTFSRSRRRWLARLSGRATLPTASDAAARPSALRPAH